MDRPQPHNFGAGPAQLPTSVLQQAAKDLINYQNLGLGVGEISHRSKEATKVINDSKQHLKELLSIPETYEVFFMQGGGTGGFSSIAANMACAFAGKSNGRSPGTAGYVVTGSWSEKAMKEAARLGFEVKVLTNTKSSSASGKYDSLPQDNSWMDQLKATDFSYVYLCENETVDGVEWPEIPDELVSKGVPIVADLSSNILSKDIDVSKYDVIVAGAQKNIGFAGLTVYIVKKIILDDIVKFSDDELRQMGISLAPIASHWPTVVKNNSAYNTIPIFNLHLMDLVFQDLKAKGGLEAQQRVNEIKAALLYEKLEDYPEIFKLPVARNARSKMNVIFTLTSPELEHRFLEESTKLGITGLKGHRSVGGMRASLYNAVELSSVQKLVDFIDSFAKS